MKFVKAEKPVTTTHAKLGDLSVDVEVPQVESLEEFSQFAGGNDNAVAFINNAIETAAKNGGRAMLRNAAEDADKTELFAKVQSTTRDYTPGTAQRGVSQKAKAASYDAVKELVESGKEFTKEELLALLAASK
jgi:hypothetical protein